MGNAFITRTSGIRKEYVDKQDDKKVDKQEGKMLSSNDFTDNYKSKVESALQGITCGDKLVNPKQNIINLTPAILGAMASNAIEKLSGGSTHFLRIYAERISSNSIGSFYVVTSDNAGNGIFANSGEILIYHMAIDIGDPTRYLVSIGYKGGGTITHHLNVISSNAMALGAKNNLGTQVINSTDNRGSYVRQMALCVRLN